MSNSPNGGCSPSKWPKWQMGLLTIYWLGWSSKQGPLIWTGQWNMKDLIPSGKPWNRNCSSIIPNESTPKSNLCSWTSWWPQLFWLFKGTRQSTKTNFQDSSDNPTWIPQCHFSINLSSPTPMFLGTTLPRNIHVCCRSWAILQHLRAFSPCRAFWSRWARCLLVGEQIAHKQH